MLKQNLTNLEVYREALSILEDFQGFDSLWDYPDRQPAVIATIVFQLLQNKEGKEK
jgi:hypothetical protein